MSLVRVHNFSISLDGFGAGEPQSFESPFGHAGHRLHQWLMATSFWDPAGTTGVDLALASRHEAGFGAEIMGSNKFGPPGWQDDPDWRGWWGEDPPYHAPVFVVTHHGREPLPMAGGTTFHFVTDGVAAAVERAKEAAGDGYVLVSGGAAVVNQAMHAGLVDELWLHVAPVLLGGGERLFEGAPLADLEQVEVHATDLVTHLRYRVPS